MDKPKPYAIPHWLVYQAYERAKANRGAAGVDGESLRLFEEDLKNNLYKIWNRMSSGSDFPPPVKAVEIPKKVGGVRILGVPTVADRIVQTVVKLTCEPQGEPVFHPDSYGYRPGRFAHDALAQTRRRCWRYDWVREFDINGLFDNIPHDLLMKAGANTPAIRGYSAISSDGWSPRYSASTARKNRVHAALHRVRWLARCWRICSCIMPSMSG